MERKQRIAFIILMIFVLVVFILSPLLGKLYCTEPEPTFTMMFLHKSGLMTSRPVCPTVDGTFLSAVKNVIRALMGGLVGYLYGRGDDESAGVTVREEEVDDVYARKLRYLRSVMTEVHFPEDFVHESLLEKRSIF